MKKTEKKVTTVKELEKLIQMERLEDRLEMAQLIIVGTTTIDNVEHAAKNDCMPGNNTSNK